jgi:hypothetical protein
MNTNQFPATRRILEILLAILIIALLVVLSVYIPPTSGEVAAPAQSSPTASPTFSFSSIAADQYPFQKVRLAWFYKPPEEHLLPFIAENFDVFILTHKDEAERDALKSLGVKAPILLYLQLLEIKDPGSCTERPQGNQVAYRVGDFCQISEQHPDWFLLDRNGNRIGDNESVYMDPGHPEYRAFWLERARALQEQYNWDGFFIDNLEASLSKMTAQGIVPSKYPDDESYQAAIEGFLQYLRANYFEPREQPVLANIISLKDWDVWLHYQQYLDGAMIEAFAVDWNDDYRSTSDWERQMRAIDEALARGKKMILVAQANELDPNRQQFAFASYLLIANDNTSFRYADGSSGYRKVVLYENYNLEFGQPLGPRYKDGSAWRRDFTNGYVLVDPEKKRVEIQSDP